MGSTSGGDGSPTSLQSGAPAGPEEETTLVLELTFPRDSTVEEQRALMGQELMLVGHSDHPSGMLEERVVVVSEDLHIRADGLHPWIYGLQVLPQLTPGQVDDGLGTFRLALDQTFYPREGRTVSEPLVLERGVSLEGVVIDGTGQPAAEAEVAAVWASPSIHGFGAREAYRCDEAGRFRFENVPSALTSLEAYVDHTARVQLSGSTLRLAMMQPHQIRLELRAVPADLGGFIEVRSLDRNGSVLRAPQREVSIHRHFDAAVPPAEVAERGGGFIRYGPLPPAAYRVQREVQSHNRHAYLMLFEDVIVVAGEVVRLTLDESLTNHDVLKTSVKGSVYFDFTKVPGASVTVRDEMGIVARGFTDRRGHYDLALSTAGPVVLEAVDVRTKSTVAASVEVQPGKHVWTELKTRAGLPARGPSAWGRFARAATSAGDVNRDGADDLLVTQSLDEVLPWYRSVTLVVSGATGQLIMKVPQDRFRRHCVGVGGVGDADGDGSPDFVTRFKGRTGRKDVSTQGLQLRSGRDGATILEHLISPLGVAGKTSVSARVIGDRNGDGVLDVGIARRSSLEQTPAIVWIEILDGANFELIQRFEFNLIDSGWGEWCLPGDLDQDGVEDLMIRAIDLMTGEEPRWLAISGRTRRSIEAWEKRMLLYTPSSFTPAGDIDGDGTTDLFAMRQKDKGLGQVEVTLRALSGRTDAVLSEHVRVLPHAEGIKLARIADVDGDGVQDLLLLSHCTFLLAHEPAGVTVHSGADLSLLHRLKSPYPRGWGIDHFGVDGFSLTDVTGDGVPDIAVRAMHPYGASNGYIQLFSGKDGESLRTITAESTRAR